VSSLRSLWGGVGRDHRHEAEKELEARRRDAGGDHLWVGFVRIVALHYRSSTSYQIP
jgi:hypothetical protein